MEEHKLWEKDANIITKAGLDVERSLALCSTFKTRRIRQSLSGNVSSQRLLNFERPAGTVSKENGGTKTRHLENVGAEEKQRSNLRFGPVVTCTSRATVARNCHSVMASLLATSVEGLKTNKIQSVVDNHGS